RWLVEIEAGHFVTAGGQLGHQPATPAAWLQEPVDAKRTIFSACGLDKVRLLLGVALEGYVVIVRIIEPVCCQDATPCHCQLTSDLHGFCRIERKPDRQRVPFPRKNLWHCMHKFMITRKPNE